MIKLNIESQVDQENEDEQNAASQILQEYLNFEIQQSDLEEQREYFQLYKIQILERKMLDMFFDTQEHIQDFQQKWEEFFKQLKAVLLPEEKDLPKYQELNSLINQFFSSISEVQIKEIIENWQHDRLPFLKIFKIIDYDFLNSLILVPTLKNIIHNIVFNHKINNQFDFYQSLILEIIQLIINSKQNKQVRINEENIFRILEMLAINFIMNSQGISVMEQATNEFQFQQKTFFKHKQIIDFFIASHFDRCLSMLSEDYFENKTEIFLYIRDKSKIGQFNFLLKEFKGSINYLKERYKSNERQKNKLIQMVLASAFIPNFEQEAGNAMTMLSNLESIIQNQDFSNIKLINCSLNNIHFFFSNLSGSIMNNISIVSAQFIECQLQNTRWNNLESSYLNILSGQMIFSAHSSILILINYNDTICFLNLHTNKRIKVLDKKLKRFNQLDSYEIQTKSLKLSCSGQVLVFKNQKMAVFWSIQSNKKIRVNKTRSVLSHNCQIMAQQNHSSSAINIWRIYSIQQFTQIQIQTQNLLKIKFSKNDKLLILHDAEFGIWEIQDGQELKSIPKGGRKFKFSPDGMYYAYCFKQGLWLGRIDGELRIEIQNQHSFYYKFSFNGNLLAIQNLKYLSIYQVNDHKLLQQLKYRNKNNLLNIMQFSPDEHTLAFANNGSLALWNFSEINQFHFLIGNQSQIKKIRFSNNGQHLTSEDSFQKSIQLWNFKNQQKQQSLSFNNLPYIQEDLSFSNNNQYLGFTEKSLYSKIKVIKIVELNDMQVLHEVNFRKQDKITSIKLSPDFKCIAYCINHTLIYFYQIEEGKLNNVNKHGKRINVQFEQHGKFFGQIDDGLIEEINNDLEFEKNIQDLLQPRCPDEQMKFSPDGEYLMVFLLKLRSSKGEIWSLQVWKIKKLQLIYQSDLDNEEQSEYHIKQFEFSQDSYNIAIPYYRHIYIFNLRSQELINLVQDYHLSKTLAFSLEGKYLASDDNKNNICVWKIEEKQIISKFQGHSKGITKIIFLNENYLISASEDCSIRIWNVFVGQQIQELNFHLFGIEELSISPDRSIIVSKDNKGVVYFWSNIKSNNSQMQCGVSTKDDGAQTIIKEYFYTPHKSLWNQRFLIKKCQTNGSQFYSTEGFNLNNVFT